MRTDAVKAQNLRVGETKTEESSTANEALSLAMKKMRDSGGVPTDAVAVLAHEIRNPLNAMIGFTEMLRSEIHGAHADPRYQDYSETLHTAAHNLLRICNRLLDQEMVQELPAPIAEGTISAAKVIAGTVELYAAMARERGVELTMAIDNGFPRLRIDEDLLEGVLGDLVSNAIKFTPAGGQVTIKASVSAETGAAILVISDTGIGMEPATIVKLLRDLPVPSGVGPHGDKRTGLGLGLVRTRLSNLGIKLDFCSQVNVGTSVTMTFPETITEPATV
jgi:two-component system, cell cycle sensor histidine kinase PleC